MSVLRDNHLIICDERVQKFEAALLAGTVPRAQRVEHHRGVSLLVQRAQLLQELGNHIAVIVCGPRALLCVVLRV